MSYFNYNNVSVQVDSRPFLAESVSINANAAFSSDRLIYRKFSEKPRPEGPLKGNIKLTYPITGKDYLSDFIASEKPIRINVGGLIIPSGYLTSYDFDLGQFSPIEASVSIDFWGQIEGSFSKSKETLPVSGVLTSNEAILSINGLDITNSLVDLNYSYSSKLEADILVGNDNPREIRFLEKEISLELKTYAIGQPLSYLNNNVDVDIAFGGQSYKSSGVLDSKVHSFNLGEKVYSTFSLKQNMLGGLPVVTSKTINNFTKRFTIVGNNLAFVNSVIFPPGIPGEILATSDNGIEVKIPNGAIKGFATILSLGGEAVTDFNYTVSTITL